MTARLAASIVTVCLSAAPALAQTPNLSRQQRDLLQAIVTAVDAANAQPALDDANWNAHLMRASDGSHYVAFTIAPPTAAPLPTGPALLYLRVATAHPPGATPIAERSAIREWLSGGRTDPRLLPRKGIAIGEMPVMGATSAMGSQRQPVTTGVNEMRLMALERERAKQKQEEQEKQRRAELEGKATVARELFPFEDFDLASHSLRDDGARVVSRAFTAGPGDYDVFVGWADPANPKPATTVRVVRKTLHLPPATLERLTTGSIILADKVSVRAAPYSPMEQASHPYSIGLMEIAPARHATYTRDESLSVAFQIINARGSDAGMPDLAVGFRIVRVNGERETPVASLNPQYYNATTHAAGFRSASGTSAVRGRVGAARDAGTRRVPAKDCDQRSRRGHLHWRRRRFPRRRHAGIAARRGASARAALQSRRRRRRAGSDGVDRRAGTGIAVATTGARARRRRAPAS